MTTPLLISRTTKLIKANAPELLMGFGITGVVMTAYLTGKATAQAVRVIDEDERKGGVSDDPRENLKRHVRLTWKFFVPAGATGVATVGCIFGLQSVSARRAAAAATAYAIAERGFAEYREQVVEQIGKGPERKIREKVAQKKVDSHPASSEVVYIGKGHILCCELHTHRYFRSDMETLKKAENDINARINRERYVTLSELYDILGLPHTSVSSNIGWDSDKLLTLQISSALAEDGEPCLAFDYNYVKPL